jgi:hypothetical protein
MRVSNLAKLSRYERGFRRGVRRTDDFRFSRLRGLRHTRGNASSEVEDSCKASGLSHSSRLLRSFDGCGGMQARRYSQRGSATLDQILYCHVTWEILPSVIIVCGELLKPELCCKVSDTQSHQRRDTESLGV